MTSSSSSSLLPASRRKHHPQVQSTRSTVALFAASSSSSSAEPISTQSPMFAAHVRRQQEQSSNDIDNNSNNNQVTVTYLEINSWLLTVPNSNDNGSTSTTSTTILVDPLLEGPLEFGKLPSWIYSARKRVLAPGGVTASLLDAPVQVDVILLTQGLDDHAHVPTLTAIRKYYKNASSGQQCPTIVAPPSARAALTAAGWEEESVQFVKHGQQVGLNDVTIRATQGALVGPPWQQRENGYLIRSNNGGDNNSNGVSVYLEPHVEFSERELQRLAPVDICISPVTGQALSPAPFSLPLPQFELVHGPTATARLVEILRPAVLVPMTNGNVDATGVLSQFVRSVGEEGELERKLLSPSLATKQQQQQSPRIQTAPPGQDVTIEITQREE
mmetsp:Transcript_9136/g.25280  ORF Transcript_9136/g.25280 Transcript_9136/m.25280 type:complete len:387 (+) Transcript_9136:87-1247(+)